MYQDAINGDRIARAEFIRLLEVYRIATIVETGTFHGVTTHWLTSLGLPVHSVEINPRYQATAIQRLTGVQNIKLHLGNSPQILLSILPRLSQPVFFFLDAHWGGHCPLLDELGAMATAGIINPIIAIHDFLVPDTTLGYDTYQGIPFTLEYVESKLPHLYPTGYRTAYNTAEGARRGILYVTPHSSNRMVED